MQLESDVSDSTPPQLLRQRYILTRMLISPSQTFLLLILELLLLICFTCIYNLLCFNLNQKPLYQMHTSH